jgi:hypothetical protein
MAAPLARVFARIERAAPGLEAERLPNPGSRLENPAASSGSLATSRRLAARGERLEAIVDRPAPRTLHRPAKRPVDAPVEAPPPVRRRPAAAVGMPGLATGMALPGPGDLDRLTEQVVRRIDRRMTAWRERTGRAR